MVDNSIAAKRDNSLAYLNILKFFTAIIIAVFYHNSFLTHYSSHNIPIISFLHGNAYLLTEFFFIISGLLFYKAYFNRLYNSKITFKSVLKKRILSIYVISTIFTLYVFLIDYISFAVNNGNMYNDSTTSFLALFVCLLCGGGGTLFDSQRFFGSQHLINGPAWYLTSLLFAYVVALLITFIIFKLKKKIFILLYLIPFGIGMWMYYSCYIYGKTLAFLWNVDISRGLIFFFLGIYLMILFEQVNKLKVNWKTVIKLICLSIALTFIILLFFKDIRGQLGLVSRFKLGFILYPTLLLGLYDWKWLNNFASKKQVNAVTRLSTEIYMLNYPIHTTMFLIGYNNIDIFLNMGYWFLIFDIALHLILGYVTYLLITKKLSKVVNKLVDKIILSIRQLIEKHKLKNS